jgi:hypothetical protein
MLAQSTLRLQPPSGYGQAARLLRGPVDPKLSPPAEAAPPVDEVPVRELADVTRGLPLSDTTAEQVQALADSGRPPFGLSQAVRALLTADETPAPLVLEITRRATRWAKKKAADAPKTKRPAVGTPAALNLRKAGVIKVGPHGGQIVGYAHGDMTRPIYAGKNDHLTHAHVYPTGSGPTGHAVEVPVQGAQGPYAWADHPDIAGGAPAVVHLPTGRTIKAVQPKPGAGSAGEVAAKAVAELGQNHGGKGLDASPGGFVSKPDYAAMRAVIEKHEKSPPPVKAPPPAPAAPAGPLDGDGAKALAAHVAQASGMTHDEVRAALTATDASPKNNDVAQARAKIEAALLKSGARPNALVELLDGGHHEQAHVDARLDQIGSGDVARAKAEYAHTPVYDLEILTSVDVVNDHLPGQAWCSYGRKLTMGLGPDGEHVTGDFRHELGHAVRFAWGPGPMSKVVFDHYDAAKAAEAATPPQGKPSHEWFETTYGVIGRRALDSAEEDAAEHYRGYHREALRHRFKKNGGGQLDTYRQRHPEMAALWDARYTAALLASLARKGSW